jgi:hypothetical protein
MRAVHAPFDNLDLRMWQLRPHSFELSRFGARITRAVNEKRRYHKIRQLAIIKIMLIVRCFVRYTDRKEKLRSPSRRAETRGLFPIQPLDSESQRGLCSEPTGFH